MNEVEVEVAGARILVSGASGLVVGGLHPPPDCRRRRGEGAHARPDAAPRCGRRESMWPSTI